MNAGAKVDQTAAAPVSAPLGASVSPSVADMAPVRIILWTMCLAHFLNDLLQSLLVAIFSIL